MSTLIKRVFVIGATGAQGLPVVRGLAGDGRYSVLALTRDAGSARASALRRVGDVSLLQGSFADEEALRAGFRACEGAYVNIDGFNAGEKTEMYWAMRAYEIALEEGVRFFVYGNLDYVLKKARYDSRFRTAHYDGKGRVGEWLLAQNAGIGSRMGVALLTTGPYMEMALSSRTPMTPTVENGVLTWRVPLGDGAVVHVALDDCAYYARWLFDNAEEAHGMDLEVALEHVGYANLASAFEKVTGRPARYVDVDLDTYFGGPLEHVAGLPAAYNADPEDRATMSFRENFTGFWNMWRHNVIQRDYDLLDSIHPRRIRSVEEWLSKADAAERMAGRGGLWERVQPHNLRNHTILKLSEDGRGGRL